MTSKSVFSFSLFYAYVHFIIFGAEKRSLFHAHGLKIFQHPERVNAVDQNDRVARPEFNFAQPLTIIAVKLHHDAAPLHDEHLLEVGDFARKRFVIMRRLGKSGLVGEEAELKRRFRRRKEFCLVDAHVGANDLRVFDSAVSNNFCGHDAERSELNPASLFWRQKGRFALMTSDIEPVQFVYPGSGV